MPTNEQQGPSHLAVPSTVSRSRGTADRRARTHLRASESASDTQVTHPSSFPHLFFLFRVGKDWYIPKSQNFTTEDDGVKRDPCRRRVAWGTCAQKCGPSTIYTVTKRTLSALHSSSRSLTRNWIRCASKLPTSPRSSQTRGYTPASEVGDALSPTVIERSLIEDAAPRPISSPVPTPSTPTDSPRVGSTLAQNVAEQMVQDMAPASAVGVEELHVYDFDGTLVNTPVPEVGMVEFEEATGIPWPHKGWWGRKESLEEPLTWEPGPAYDTYTELLAVPRCKRVMLTGRRQKLAPQVKKIMSQFDIKVDEAIFNYTSHDTFTYKCAEIKRLVRLAGSGLRRVRIWEDRVTHAKGFQELGSNKEFAHIDEWEVILVEPSNDF